MTSVKKSPNIRSTTGRSPVIAAPTPRPVNPGSEMGVSTTRCVPNSSTRPLSTLNGVPASATSSPITKTSGSRRISSTKAAFTAWANVSSGIEILRDLRCVGEGRVERELQPRLDLGTRLVRDADQVVRRSELLLLQPAAEDGKRVAFAAPQLLLVLRAVVTAVDVADVMAVVAVSV